MIKKTRNAQRRIRRLTGRVDRVAENVGRAQAACVQAVAMYGSELRWKGGKENSTIGRAENLQIISSSHHRLLQKHGPGQLMLLSGLRPAHSLLNNRGRRFALRMASLPEGGQAGQLVGTPSELGTRLSTCLVSPEGMKRQPCTMVSLEAIIVESTPAKQRKPRHRSHTCRQDSGACGYILSSLGKWPQSRFDGA